MTSTVAMAPSSPIRNRWVQLIFGIVAMIMIANLQYGWTLFVTPIREHFHWATAAIQVTFTTFVLVETWLVPVEGYIIDRFGPSRITIVGGILVGISWTLFSVADSLTLYYLGSVIAGVGAGIVYGCTVGQALKWFPDRRGLAAGLTAAGFGAGSALTIVPIAQMINNIGFQKTFLIFGIVQGVVVVLIGFLLRAPRPGEVPPAPAVVAALKQTLRDFTPGEMLRTPLFYIMYIAMLCVAVGGVMATAQLGPIARDYLVDEVPITLLFTLPALQWALVFDRVLNGLARPAFGWLSDRIGRENTMFIAFGSQCFIILIFIKVAANPMAFVIMSALVFFTYGEIFSLFPSLNADTYGRKYATTNYGLLYTAKGTAAILVPFGNILKDMTGSWVPIFQAAAALNLCAALIAFFVIKPLRARKAERERALTPEPGIPAVSPT